MSSQPEGLNALESPHVGPQTLFTRLRGAAASVLREVGDFLHAVTNLRNELRRMADECEATQPDQAARLRRVASSNWGE